MTSLAITIRTVDSVPSWPALRGPWSENWVNPFSDAPDKCKVCEASGISVDPLPARRSGGREHSIPSAGARRGEKSDATRVVSTFGA